MDDTGAGEANGAALDAPHLVRRHRAGLAATAVLIGIVLVALPFALRSMADELFGRQQGTLYDLMTNAPVSPAATALDDPDQAPAPVGGVLGGLQRAYINIAVVTVDEVAGSVTLAVSGNRECRPSCPTASFRLFALDDNAAQRRGLPPSAAVTLGPADRVFSESLVLPLRGQPSLFPFDSYDLWLGFAIGIQPAAGGEPVTPDLATLARVATFTLQNQESGLVMAPPDRIDPHQVRAPSDPEALPLVEALHFERPAYLKVLAVLLVLLISTSGLIALAKRELDDLVLGVGGLILGVWGIRSVLITRPLPGPSAVDLALSLVILLLLLGLTVRLAGHFHRGSRVSLDPRRWRRAP